MYDNKWVKKANFITCKILDIFSQCINIKTLSTFLAAGIDLQVDINSTKIYRGYPSATTPAHIGTIAQLGERLTINQEVGGSSPPGPT